MGRPSYPVQREPVVIEITLRLRPGGTRVEITKVVVRAGNVQMWRPKLPLKPANHPADHAGRAGQKWRKYSAIVKKTE
jgi:hypothetical protein